MVLAQMTEIDASLPHYEVRKLIAGARPGKLFDTALAGVLSLKVGPPYSTDLDTAVGAIHGGPYWWHISHLEAAVTPTDPVPGVEKHLSNGQRCDREGRPIWYRSMVTKHGHAMALCIAWVKAVYDLPDAYYVDASALKNAWEKPPPSREFMMAYYNAREDLRQAAIQRKEP